MSVKWSVRWQRHPLRGDCTTLRSHTRASISDSAPLSLDGRGLGEGEPPFIPSLSPPRILNPTPPRVLSLSPPRVLSLSPPRVLSLSKDPLSPRGRGLGEGEPPRILSSPPPRILNPPPPFILSLSPPFILSLSPPFILSLSKDPSPVGRGAGR